MIFEFQGIKVFYKFFDNQCDITNVFLHGWGRTHNDFLACKDFLLKQNNLFVDFPPFGQSNDVHENWCMWTYVNLIASLCEKVGAKYVNLIGHSFGGRVAILLASVTKIDVRKLILVDSAGCRPKKKLNYFVKVFIYKIRKKFHSKNLNMGSVDYKNLSPKMKKVFVDIVTTYLEEFLPLITCQTLILFGKNDKETPIYMARKLHKKIKNSSLLLLDDCGHFPFIERRLEFEYQLKNFLEK